AGRCAARGSGFTPVWARIFVAVDAPIAWMYVSAPSILLFRGRSTPAIRAMRLSLPLLVSRIPLADDPDHPTAPDHLAVLTDRLDAAPDLHAPALLGVFRTAM